MFVKISGRQLPGCTPWLFAGMDRAEIMAIPGVTFAILVNFMRFLLTHFALNTICPFDEIKTLRGV